MLGQTPRSTLPLTGVRWVAFARDSDWGRRLRLRLVSGAQSLEANFAVEHDRSWDVRISGELAGQPFEWKAEARTEVDGVTARSRPVFAGTFAQVAGTSGHFAVRRRGEELLTLGVLGSETAIAGIIDDPSSLDCPVIVRGLPDLEFILEHLSMAVPTRLDVDDIRRAGPPNEYIGYSLDYRGSVGTGAPALAAFIALLLADEFLIRRHYLTGLNS